MVVYNPVAVSGVCRSTDVFAFLVDSDLLENNGENVNLAFILGIGKTRHSQDRAGGKNKPKE